MAEKRETPASRMAAGANIGPYLEFPRSYANGDRMSRICFRFVLSLLHRRDLT
jgi:hypothetical protein